MLFSILVVYKVEISFLWKVYISCVCELILKENVLNEIMKKKVIFWVRYSEISWKKKLLENLEIKLWYRKLGFEIL